MIQSWWLHFPVKGESISINKIQRPDFMPLLILHIQFAFSSFLTIAGGIVAALRRRVSDRVCCSCWAVS